MAAHARSHPWIARTIKVASIGCVSGALAIGAWLGWFYVHSAIGGAGLLAQARARITAADGSSQRNGCRLPRASGSGAVGEIVVPSLSLVAPVVQGDGAAQLADAVGHVPTSVWPGQAGTPVFAGHDVTWFHDLGHLKPGQEIEYVSGCRARVYAVLRNEIVGQGTLVENIPGSLALVTCWPLDALWFTGQRMLVVAHALGGSVDAPAVNVPSSPPVPALAVPPSLVSVDSLLCAPPRRATLSHGRSSLRPPL